MRHEPGSNASTDLKKKICMCLISVFRSLYLAVAVTLLEVCILLGLLAIVFEQEVTLEQWNAVRTQSRYR